ncbi:MAG: polymorphic toxin type 17 domain-containing protein [Gammaproteobacteria bacterium]
MFQFPYFAMASDRADTAMPYHLFAECLRQQLPFLPFPREEEPDNQFWHTVIPILAVALACVAAPYIAGALFGVTTSAAAATATGATLVTATTATTTTVLVTTEIAQAALAGLVNASLQDVAVMAGVQDKFSYGQVFSAMTAAGVVGGSGATTELGAAASQATKVATLNVSRQLVQLAAGEIHRFDAMSVVTDVTAALATMGINKFISGESLVTSPDLKSVPETNRYMHLHQATGLVTELAVEQVRTGHISMESAAQHALGLVAMNGSLALDNTMTVDKRAGKDQGIVHTSRPGSTAHRKTAPVASSSHHTSVDLSDVRDNPTYHAASPSSSGLFGEKRFVSEARYQLSEQNRERMGQHPVSTPSASSSRSISVRTSLGHPSGSLADNVMHKPAGYYQQAMSDRYHALDAKWHITTRAAGLAEATFGAQLAVSAIEGGVLTWPTIAGPLIGAGVATLGADHAWAGAKTLVTGGHHDTFLSQALHSRGGNQLAADAILFGADLASSAPMVVANGASNLLSRGVNATQLVMDGLHSATDLAQSAMHGAALEAEHFLKPYPDPSRAGWSFFAGHSKMPGTAENSIYNQVEIPKVWSKRARINSAQLPVNGTIRFVPRENYSPSTPLIRGPNNGYLDRFGNEWVKGPSRTSGQAFEWDVQLSDLGKKKLGWRSRDGSHVNISLDGHFTHR